MSNINTTISHLKSAVSRFKVNNGDTFFKKNASPNFKFSYILYGLLPVFAIVLLLIIKPQFIMQTPDNIADPTDTSQRKLSLKKFCLTIVVVLFIAGILVFSYLYKKS